MGQFSWLDCETREQVLDNVERDVYVLIPKEFGGGHIKEDCYDGYGHFGSSDIYDLVVDWNRNYLDHIDKDTWRCDWIKTIEEDLIKVDKGEKEKRDVGIALACYDEDNFRLKYPIKITHDENAIYEDCTPSESDPDQGWLMEDDEDEEDDWLEDDDYDEDEEY